MRRPNPADHRMLPVQMRMARAAVGWGVRELAKKAGVTANTVTRIENGGDAKQSTMTAIQRALEVEGVEFTDGGQPGVRMKPVARDAAALTGEIAALEQQVATMPAEGVQSPTAAMNTMRKAVAENDLTRLRNRRARLK